MIFAKFPENDSVCVLRTMYMYIPAIAGNQESPKSARKKIPPDLKTQVLSYRRVSFNQPFAKQQHMHATGNRGKVLGQRFGAQRKSAGLMFNKHTGSPTVACKNHVFLGIMVKRRRKRQIDMIMVMMMVMTYIYIYVFIS